MVFSVTNVGDNPFAPGAYGYSYTPDQLIAGGMQRVTHNILLMSGTLPRGAIVGRQTNFSVLSAHGVNTGDGTIGAISPGLSVQTGGSYAIAATGATTFSVTDPEGSVIGNATVGTPFTSGEINFTLTAGGTAFVAGDSFTLAAQRSDGNFILCVKSASDGSQNPVAVLADAADASSAPVVVGAYFTGEFNANSVSYDSSWTLYDISSALQVRAIHLKNPVTAADPH